MNRRSVLWSVLAFVLVAVVAGVWWMFRPLPTLTVATWAGPYARAQANAMFRPYSEANRIDVRLAEYDGGIEGVRAEIAAHKYDWDVVDFELDDAVEACAQHLLEPIDPSVLLPGADGAVVRADFVRHALGPCWVGSVVFSQVVVYSKTRLASDPPRTIADFFDLSRYPGPRALRRSNAKLNLELALLADGVKPDAVYDVLSTPNGVARALAKLDTIRPAIVWWTSSADAVAMVEDGRATFATALNGDAYDALIHHRPLGVIWDRQLYELDVFGIPRGDPKKDQARDFVSFATGSAPLARVADWVPYGPARRSSRALVGHNPDLGIAMAPFLPTTGANFATAFAVDDRWWRDHGAAIAPLWDAWLAGAH